MIFWWIPGTICKEALEETLRAIAAETLERSPTRTPRGTPAETSGKISGTSGIKIFFWETSGWVADVPAVIYKATPEGLKQHLV